MSDGSVEVSAGSVDRSDLQVAAGCASGHRSADEVAFARSAPPAPAMSARAIQMTSARFLSVGILIAYGAVVWQVTGETVPPELFLHQARARKAVPVGSKYGLLPALEWVGLCE